MKQFLIELELLMKSVYKQHELWTILAEEAIVLIIIKNTHKSST
jgi:hypothetical protein